MIVVNFILQKLILVVVEVNEKILLKLHFYYMKLEI